MKSVINNLYQTFKPYKLGDDFAAESIFYLAKGCKYLASIPLRELTLSDLNLYPFKAISTWGNVRHFKHFLPRLLELALDDYLAFNFPEVLLGKLTQADWKSWPTVEQEVVSQFLDSFWLRQLHWPDDASDIDRVLTVLGGLAEACGSIKPYLETWEKQTKVRPAMQLAQLIDFRADKIMTTGTVHLWGEPKLASAELVKWLSSPAPFRLLEPFRDTITQRFPDLFDKLDWMRAAYSTD